MPEHVPASERDITGHVDAYMQRLGERAGSLSLTQADSLADQLDSNGTPAFHTAEPDQVVFISAATSREAQLADTLSQAARSARRSPRSPLIVVSANYQDGDAEHERQIADNMALISSFGDAHPDLPFSFFDQTYPAGTPIGTVRGDTYNGGIRAHQRQAIEHGRPVRDLLLTNMDADTRGTPEEYFARLQRRYDATQAEAWMGYPVVRHEKLDPRFPAANQILAWYDLLIRATKNSLPAHFSMNLRAYAADKGFEGDMSGEQFPLWRMAINKLSSSERGRIDDLVVVTSNRRLVGQMAAGIAVGYSLLTAGGPDIEKLTGDVSEDYYQYAIQNIVFQVFNAAFSTQYDLLKKQGCSDWEAENQARWYANKVVSAGATIIGQEFSLDDALAAQRYAANRRAGFTDDQWVRTRADLRRLTSMQAAGEGTLSTVEQIRLEVYEALNGVPLDAVAALSHAMDKAFNTIIDTLQGTNPQGKGAAILRPLLDVMDRLLVVDENLSRGIEKLNSYLNAALQ